MYMNCKMIFFIIIKTYGNIDLPLRVICEGVVEKTPCELTRKAPETKQKKTRQTHQCYMRQNLYSRPNPSQPPIFT